MKITIYELLGLIKDGKAPKKIRKIDRNKHNIFLFYDEELKNYYDEDGNHPLFPDDIALDLNDEIEIIEDNKKIEKLDLEEAGIHRSLIRTADYIIQEKINKIIDKLNEGDK